MIRNDGRGLLHLIFTSLKMTHNPLHQWFDSKNETRSGGDFLIDKSL